MTMGTLATELADEVIRRGGGPRIYVDANVPAGLVAFMRRHLGWDVLFVMEHDELRRARDEEHYRLARQWRRTLVSLDRDFIDDRRFPPDESGGVVVLSAPGEHAFRKLLRQLHTTVFAQESSGGGHPSPLVGCKLEAHPGWRAPENGDRGSETGDRRPGRRRSKRRTPIAGR